MDVEHNWESIAKEIARRLNFAISYGKFSGFYMNMATGETRDTLDYLADGLEMLPGVKVDREALHMTPKQRAKHKKEKESKAKEFA